MIEKNELTMSRGPNAVEFLSEHRVLLRRQVPGKNLLNLDKHLRKVQKNSESPTEFRKYRSKHISTSAVEFDKQLDKIAVWLDKWNHSQRCKFLEELLGHSSYTQLQLLHTVLQPNLHRDFIYTVRSRFPDIQFKPISTHFTRKLKEKLKKLRLTNGFHRMTSAHVQSIEDFEKLKLPRFDRKSNVCSQSVPAISKWSSSEFLAHRRDLHNHKETNKRQLDTWRDDKEISTNCVATMPIRRHLQEDVSLNDQSLTAAPVVVRDSPSLDASTELSKSSGKTKDHYPSNGLPQEGKLILKWYKYSWNDRKKNEFFHKLIMKLDPLQHYFISSLLCMQQSKDIVGLLPEDLALRILEFLTPRELLVTAMVNKRWEELSNSNTLWKKRCSRVCVDVPIPEKPIWKQIYKDNLYLRMNWNLGRCATVDFKGHTNSVLSVTVDEEGNRLATGSQDKTIKVWDLKTGNLISTLKGHLKGVWCLQFFTKHLLVSGSFDGSIKIWNLRKGVNSRTLLGHKGQVWCLRMHKPILVSGSQDKTAKIWDIGRCVLLHTLMGHNGAVFCVDVSDDGSLAITGSADRSVRLWSTDSGQQKKVIWVSPKTSVMSVSYSEGYLVCCYDAVICLYKSFQLVKTFEEHDKRIESLHLRIVDVDQGKGYIISAGQDGSIKYWDTTKEDSVQTFKGHSGAVNCVYVDRLRIASASLDHTIKVFDFNVGMPPLSNDDSDLESADEDENTQLNGLTVVRKITAS